MKRFCRLGLASMFFCLMAPKSASDLPHFKCSCSHTQVGAAVTETLFHVDSYMFSKSEWKKEDKKNWRVCVDITEEERKRREEALAQTLAGLCFPLLHPVSVSLCGPELRVIPKQSALIQGARGPGAQRCQSAIALVCATHVTQQPLYSQRHTAVPPCSLWWVWCRSVWSDAALWLKLRRRWRSAFFTPWQSWDIFPAYFWLSLFRFFFTIWGEFLPPEGTAGTKSTPDLLPVFLLVKVKPCLDGKKQRW